MTENKKLSFTEENIKKELALCLGYSEEDITDIRENNDWNATYFEIEINGEEYMITEDTDDAETIAQDRVKQDLEQEPELFNKEWLNGIMNDNINGQSFIEYAAEDAVNTDGFAHFLASYDGDYQETVSGFVVMRIN